MRSTAPCAGHVPGGRTSIARVRDGIDSPGSEQEIPLGHRQNRSRRTGEELAIRANLVGLRVHLYMRRGGVEHHAVFADTAPSVFNSNGRPFELQASCPDIVNEGPAHEQ